MKEMILQGQAEGLRAAVMEHGVLMEVFEQEGPYSRLVGNIYRGRVENVLPGMQAAFVDIGLDKNAFLYVREAVPLHFGSDQESQAAFERVNIGIFSTPSRAFGSGYQRTPWQKRRQNYDQYFTSGRYVVLLPQVAYIGVSRRIQALAERERLKKISTEVCPGGMGVIVRTLAQGLSEQEIVQDIAQLIKIWRNIQTGFPKISVPGLVHQDADLVSRLIRDFIDDDVERITLDQEEVARILRQSLQAINHPAGKHVMLISRKIFLLNSELKKK